MFSLKKLVRGVEDRVVDTFNGSAPSPAVTRQQQARPMQPASTARPNPISVQPVRQSGLQSNPVQQSTIQPVTVAKPQALQAGTATIAPSPVAKSGVAQPVVAAQSNILDKPTGAFRTAATLGAGVARSAVGTGQALSGLYDLASPGTGTNRFSQSLDQHAKDVDEITKNLGLNQNVYKGAQAGSDIAQLALGSGIGKAVAKAIPGVEKVGAGFNTARQPVLNFASNLEKTGFKGRVAAGGLRGATDPRLLAGNLAQQGFYTGQDASRGEDINPVSQAAQFAAGQVALPFAGAAAKEAVAPVTDAVVGGLRRSNLIAPSRLNPQEVSDLSTFANQARSGAIMDEGIYQNGIAAAQKAGLDYRDAGAVDELLGAHRNYDTQVGQRMQMFQPTPLNSVGGIGRNVNTPKNLDDLFNDPAAAGLFDDVPATPPANAFQDILPSKTRPQAIKTIVNQGGNPLYHDTDSKGILGILDSGEIRASQAPFSSIAGQGKRVSTTRNFDNYSRYGKAPYRLVIDESKTGQRSIPDNREEFESIFKKSIPAKSAHTLAIDTTNPALLDDIKSGKLAEVIASAKAKGIAIEPFEGKILPNEAANAEIQALTKAEASKVLKASKPSLPKPPSKRSITDNAAVMAKGLFKLDENGGVGRNVKGNEGLTHPSGVPRSKLLKQSPREAVPTTPETPQVANASSLVDNTATGATKTRLNTDRMNLDLEQRTLLNKETQDSIDRLSNEEVQQAAKSAGLDTRSHTPEQTREIIAKQLNVRQDAVSLMEQAKGTANLDEKAALIKQAAERGRISREQGTDIARQLQARKILANELDTPEQRIFKLLDNAGVNPDVYSKRLAEVDFKNTKEVVKAYREMVPAKAREWLDTLRYNSMLSSPLTQAVNVFGNAQNVGLVAPIEKTLRGTIDAAGGLFGKERQYAAGEGVAYAAGAAKNIVKASNEFVDALRGSGKYANPDFEEYSIPLAQGGVKGATYKTLSAPMRVLDGMDKFFRALADGGEESALNAREKAGIAIKGNRQAIKDAEQSYRVFQTELGAPGQGILNDAFDEFANVVMRGRNAKNPFIALPAKFTVPFVKTVNNISKQGIVDYSPLGFVNLKGNADKTTAVTRAIMGSAVFGTSAALIAQGNMTWAEPRDADERARFRSEGKQPYAIKMGGKWVNFSKLTPSVSFPMAMTAALHDAMENGKTDQSMVDKVLESVAKYGNFLADQSYAKSIGDTLGAVGGDTEAIAQAVSNNVQQVVPFRALTGWVARISDGTERKVDTTQSYVDQQVQSLMQQYPGLRQKTGTRDYKGTPIAANNQVLNGFSPVKITSDRGTDAVDKALDEAKLAKEGTAGEQLTKSETAELAKLKQAQVTAGQKNLIASADFAAMTPEERSKALDKVKNKVGAQVGKDYKESKGIASKSGGSSIDVNKGINAHSQKVLNEYSNLDADTKRKKAYGENDYDYKVSLAKFDNDKANGTLSQAQEANRMTDLVKAKIGSKFDKDTREAYNLSVYELEDLAATKPDIADKVLAYDQALAGAGIIKKAKYAYGIGGSKPKKGSSGADQTKAIASNFGKISSTNQSADKALRDLIGKDRISSKSATVRKASVKRVATKKNTVSKSKVTIKRG